MAELIKHRIKGLHVINDPEINGRFKAQIKIVLSTEKLDSTHYGY